MLWYRLELVASGEFSHDNVWQDSSPAAGTVSYSDHDMRSSKWSASSAGAFILKRRRGRQVTFYANLIGKVESARRAETVTATSGDMSVVPNHTCTTTLTEKLYTPVGLTGFIRQYGQPNQLAFLVTPFPHTGNYLQTSDNCVGQTFVDSCPDGGLDCGSIYLGGGQPSALDPKDRARRLAFKLPSRGHFGHSFSIQRTVAGTLSFPADPPREGTDMYRSRVDYTLNFTACPRHGRDVKNC